MYEQRLLTVSGPTTLVGGGICLKGFLNSGPGLLRDKRLRIAVCDAKLPANPFPLGLAAKSRPCKYEMEWIYFNCCAVCEFLSVDDDVNCWMSELVLLDWRAKFAEMMFNCGYIEAHIDIKTWTRHLFACWNLARWKFLQLQLSKTWIEWVGWILLLNKNVLIVSPEIKNNRTTLTMNWAKRTIVDKPFR